MPTEDTTHDRGRHAHVGDGRLRAIDRSPGTDQLAAQVAVVALASSGASMVPAARVKLNAMTTSTSHAALERQVCQR